MSENGFYIAAGVVVLVFGLIFGISYAGSVKDGVEIAIESKERVTKTDSSKFVVFTDHGVYEVTDTFIFFDFSSADRYSELKVGKSYVIKQAGWRVPFLSWYPNILEVAPKG